MNQDRLSYLEGYLEKCWQARQYYKDEMNKLLYWAGTIFLCIVGATGVFGANQNTIFVYSWKHICVFHAVFLIGWFYYLYKRINADMFELMGSMIESYLRRSKGLNKDWEFESFFGLKGHYLGKTFGHGRSLINVANTMLVALYIVMTAAPIWDGRMSQDQISISPVPLTMCSIFPLLLYVGWRRYRREKMKVFKKMRDDWKSYCDWADRSTGDISKTLAEGGEIAG